MDEQKPETNQSPSPADAEKLFQAFKRLRARTTLGPDITVKELVETGRR